MMKKSKDKFILIIVLLFIVAILNFVFFKPNAVLTVYISTFFLYNDYKYGNEIHDAKYDKQKRVSYQIKSEC